MVLGIHVANSDCSGTTFPPRRSSSGTKTDTTITVCYVNAQTMDDYISEIVAMSLYDIIVYSIPFNSSHIDGCRVHNARMTSCLGNVSSMCD